MMIDQVVILIEGGDIYDLNNRQRFEYKRFDINAVTFSTQNFEL